QISKKSRLQFLPNDKFPPKGMNEKRYIELLMGQGCQICMFSKNCKVFWEFGIRCCLNCFKDKTLKVDLIKSYLSQYPHEILDIIPYFKGLEMKYYWMGQLSFELYQYLLSFSKNDLTNLHYWLDYKKNMFDSVMEYAELPHSSLYFLYFYLHLHSKRLIASNITEYLSCSEDGLNTKIISHYDNSKKTEKQKKDFRKHDKYQKGQNML
ncbi:9471_t:CDS:2, partial [Funneliformis geosporum]